MPYSVLAFLGNYCQTVGAFESAQDMDGHSLGNHPYALGFRFAEAFVNSATSCHLEMRRVANPDGESGGTKPGELVIQYHARYLAVDSEHDHLKAKGVRPLRPGVGLLRDRASIRRRFNRRQISRAMPESPRLSFRPLTIDHQLVEGVSSLSLSVLNTADAPYTIILLMDDDTYPTGRKRSRPWRRGQTTSNGLFPDAYSAETSGLRPSGRCIGLTQFLLMALTMFERWEAEWMSSLDHLSQVASFSVSPTESPLSYLTRIT